MYFKNPILLFAFLFIISCNSNNNDFDFKKAPSAKSLNGTAIKIEPKITMPSKIYTIDNKLIIYDKIKNNIFKVFKLPEIKHLYSWGRIGKGPNEFKLITENSMYVYENNIEFLDFNKLNIFQVEKDTFILQNQITISNLSPINNLRRLNDSICIADNPMTEKDDFEHAVINIKTNKKINKTGKYIDSYRFNNNSERYQAFFKNCVANPDNNKFAAFYSYFNLIRFYDIQKNIEKRVVLNADGIENKLIEHGKKKTIFFVEPVTVDKYIYVLMINKTRSVIETDFKNFKPKLQIWDWNGNPIIEYNLDKPITSFCVSKKYKKIYAISFFNIDKIYEFDLPDSLFNYETDNLTYKNITHKKFKAKMFSKWVLNNQMEKYAFYKKFGYNYERHVYYNPERIDNCGASITITLITTENNKKIKIDEYYKNFKPNIKDIQNYKLIKTDVNNQESYHYRFNATNTDPKGIKTNNHFAVWLIDTKNALIEIKFSSCSQFNEYYEPIKKIVASIEIVK